MLMATKVGGFICFATRTEYLTKYDYITRITELENENKWKKVKEITFYRYDQVEGIKDIGRFSKTEIKGFTYQKL